VSLGSGVALVDLLGLRLTGPLAWWIYRAAYLLKLVGAKNKVRVLTTLALNRVFERDISADGGATPFVGSGSGGRARAGVAAC
jgi:NADH dehydrogenase FAD-containing subunit